MTGEKRWSYKAKYPLLASSLATGGDLVFTGDPEGAFMAFDAVTGDKLWSFTPVRGIAARPSPTSVDGRQYVAVPSGWGSAVAGSCRSSGRETEDFPGGGALFVFALKE